MSYSLGIRIDGARIKDDDARIIALLIYGLSYKIIGDIMDYEAKTVRNHVSKLYGDLELESEVNALLRKAHAYGFDFEGNCYSQSVLDKADRARLERFAPQVKKEKSLPTIIYA